MLACVDCTEWLRSLPSVFPGAFSHHFHREWLILVIIRKKRLWLQNSTYTYYVFECLWFRLFIWKYFSWRSFKPQIKTKETHFPNWIISPYPFGCAVDWTSKFIQNPSLSFWLSQLHVFVFPNWKTLQTTTSNWMKMVERFPNELKKKKKNTHTHCGKRRNCSLRAISAFPSVFSKDLYYRHVKTRACLGKGWMAFFKYLLSLIWNFGYIARIPITTASKTANFKIEITIIQNNGNWYDLSCHS